MKRALILIPVVLSSLVLAAHVWRGGQLGLAVVVAMLPALLVVRRSWAVRTVQVVLAVGAAEWLRTLWALVERRQLLGLPYTRLAIILGAIAAVTALSAWWLASWRRPVAVATAAAGSPAAGRGGLVGQVGQSAG